MPDLLDPTDAFYSAFTGSFTRFGGFLAVSLGGHVLGCQIHELAICLAAAPAGGWSAFNGLLDFAPLDLVLSWFGTFAGSFAIWWCWPFLALDVWLLARLRGAADLFPIVLMLALAQPGHTFIVQQRTSPLPRVELTIGIGLLIACAITTTALLLWWRRTSDEAPEPEPDAELEL